MHYNKSTISIPFDFLLYFWILFVPNSLAEFEKHTFDITALEYGAEAKKAAEE